MEHGDISSDPPQRLWVLFEGLVGIPRQRPAPRAPAWLLRRRKPRPITPDDFDINPLAVGALYRTGVIDGLHVEILTFLGEDFAADLAEWLPGKAVYATVLARDPGDLARELAYRPDVRRVYFADPAYLFTFGHRGAHTPHHAAGSIGRL